MTGDQIGGLVFLLSVGLSGRLVFMTISEEEENSRGRTSSVLGADPDEGEGSLSLPRELEHCLTFSLI